MTCAVQTRDAVGADWREFVLAHGHRVRARTLALVVGRAINEVTRLRATGACVRRDKPLGFGELFALWHGRPPADHEWPPSATAGGGYEWQQPEIALLAVQVGQTGVREVAALLTKRLQAITGDPKARRTSAAVLCQIRNLGLQARDVVGGVTTTEAAAEIGSVHIVHRAISEGELQTRRVGSLHVISRASWNEWKAKRVAPPDGYVQLASLKPSLCPGTDKLAEYASLGYIDTAVKCFPSTGGIKSSARGTWFISKEVAEKLLDDRRAGRPLPWYGKPTPSNLKTTFKLLRQRMHPASCETCRKIWGEEGAPASYDDYARRYPPLEHGAKRHLTRPWVPGLTVAEVARHCNTTDAAVRRAVNNKVLRARRHEGRLFVTLTDATRWRARNCPSGDGAKSWVSLATASRRYQFSEAELRAFVASGRLRAKVGTNGPMRGVVYVLRQQCAELRNDHGFTLEEAARRARVSVRTMKRLLAGANWRRASGLVPLETVQTVIKRMQSEQGHTIEQASALLGVSEEWVQARIEDFTIRVARGRWGKAGVRISAAMLAKLRTVLTEPPAPKLDATEWLGLSEASTDAGVSAGTLSSWVEEGSVVRKVGSDGWWKYKRSDLRQRAAEYWSKCRFKRAVPPSWLASSVSTRSATGSPS